MQVEIRLPWERPRRRPELTGAVAAALARGSCRISALTQHITDAAPVMSRVKPERPRDVRRIGFVMPPLPAIQSVGLQILSHLPTDPSQRQHARLSHRDN
jgi:hypothetical protein